MKKKLIPISVKETYSLTLPGEVSDPCDAYLASHIDPEGDYLYRLYRATNIHTIHGRMASGHLQGRLLKMLVQMIRPKNILEVGTFSGYSAICMAEGLEEGGKLYTFEINDEMEAFVDGDKRNYTEVYEKLLPIIRSGGYILADNTLWDWHVIDPAYDHDQQTIGIRRFNDFIAKDDRIEKVILPLRDGLTLIRKK